MAKDFRNQSASCREVLPNSAIFQDFSLSELSPETRVRLQMSNEQSWFSSMGFAESYCFPPAERVFFLEDGSGQIIDKCFYREGMWGGVFKKIEVYGPVSPGSNLLQELQLRRRPSVIHMDRVAEPDLAGWKDTWRTRRVARVGEDCCIDLPKSASEYLQRLGSKTRKHLPYYVRRLEKEWGGEWIFENHCGANISRESYDCLLNLNRLRMDQKSIKSGWTAELRDHRWKAVKDCGLLFSLVHRCRIVGGTFSVVHANEAYLIVIAHDPQFDKLNLGTVSLWLTIKSLIQMGYMRYHLMWGHSFYKVQFGASAQPLYRLTVFENSFVAGVWHAADIFLVAKIWRLAARAWRRLSWRSPINRGGEAEDFDSSKEPFADATSPRMEKD